MICVDNARALGYAATQICSRAGSTVLRIRSQAPDRAQGFQCLTGPSGYDHYNGVVIGAIKATGRYVAWKELGFKCYGGSEDELRCGIVSGFCGGTP